MIENPTFITDVVVCESFAAEYVNFAEFILKLQDIAKRIPPAYRPEARLKIERDWDDDSNVCIDVEFDRPETDKEKAEREALEDRLRKAGKNGRRIQYEMLKKEFENAD